MLVDRRRRNFFSFQATFQEDNEGFVSGIGACKFHSVNIKCRFGSDVPNGILMKG